MTDYFLNIKLRDTLYSIRFPKSVLFLTIILLLLAVFPYPTPKPASAVGEALTISAPITLSGTYGITATRFSDKANPQFYFEPSGTSVLNSISGSLTGNATTATTATNVSGGSITATTGSFSGNVGIGTTSPGAKLDVRTATTSRFDLGVTEEPTAYYTRFEQKYDANNTFNIYGYAGGARFLNFAATGSKLSLQPDGGNVGIGTTAPGALLHVRGAGADTSSYNSLRLDNMAVGTAGTTNGLLFYWNTIEAAKVAAVLESAATWNTGLGLFTAAGTAAATEKVRITSTGNVGIGTTAPTYKFQVTGTVYASGSSRDYKQNIKPLEIDSAKIYDLQPVSYDYKKEYENLGYNLAGGRQFGFIAEDTYKIIPELVISLEDKKTANIDYEKLSVLLLVETQKQKKEIDSLKLEIKNLEQRLILIESKLK